MNYVPEPPFLRYEVWQLLISMLSFLPLTPSISSAALCSNLHTYFWPKRLAVCVRESQLQD